MEKVRELVETINREGRQGPKDLKSCEVYNWVSKTIDMSYDEYMSVINANAITESQRQVDRNAYFVIENSGKIQLFKSKEEEIRKYVCFIIRENPGITSAETIKILKIIYQDFTLVDLMEQKNLSSAQNIIDQTIRNILVSNYFKKRNNILFYRSETKPYTYNLKPEGYRLAAAVDMILLKNKNEEINYELTIDSITNAVAENSNVYSDQELSDIDDKNKSFNYSDCYGQIRMSRGRIITDPKLRATRFARTGYKCEIDDRHITFPTNHASNFLEAHHLVPISSQKNFSHINLDCIQNIVALCPNCHRQIHYATDEYKLKLFNSLVELRKEDLEFIGFTSDLLNLIYNTFY